MKNNIKKILIIVCIFFLHVNNLYSEELNFEASEVQVLDKGNKLKATNGVRIIDNNGIKINADEFEYNKITSILIAYGNVNVLDSLNQIIIKAPKIIYYKEKNLLFTEGITNILLKKTYDILSKDIVIDRKNMEAYSDHQTKITDNEKNIFELKKFNYSLNKKLIKAKKIKFTNNVNDVIFLEDALIDTNLKKIAGKDLVLKFHNTIFNNPENEPRMIGNTLYSDLKTTKVSKGVFTTCKKRDGCPPWVISAEEVEHNKVKKTINYKNAWLKVYDMPVLYFPKFFHPDPTVKRQSGFLIPKFSNSNTLGSSLDVPYFHVISESKDLTFKPRIYSKQKYIMQSEVRTVSKNSKHIFDFSLLKGHEALPGDNGDTRSHFFSNSVLDLGFKNFDQSNIEFNLESSSNDSYLKLYNLKSPIVKNLSSLNSYLTFKASRDDLILSTSIQMYEDLSKLGSDRYQFIYPDYSLFKNIETDLNGALSFESSGNQKIFDTNRKEKIIVNNFTYTNNPIISSGGFKSSYTALFKNVNTEGENSINYDKGLSSQILGAFLFKSSFPLQKKGSNFNNSLTPTLSARYSPSPTKNLVNSNTRIDINNVYSMNRIGSNDAVEGGQSLTLGAEYKITKKNLEELASLNFAQVFRDKYNPDLPTRSTINKKESDIVGELKYTPNNNFNLDYNFSLDNGLRTANYHFLKTDLSMNNFITTFKYLEENNELGDEKYLENETSFNFNKNSSLGFSTRKNRKTDLTEFYNLIYEYKNDCLVAAIEYNKTYYETNEIKPEEQIFFSLTIMPFGKTTSPNLKN